MDIFTMLQNATIFDKDTGEAVGQTIGFEVVHGRMTLEAIMFTYDEEYEDGDDGSREPIPEPNIKDKIAAIAGGRDA